MAVKIRLKRMGAKRKPFYRIVVAHSAFARDGRFVEEIGYYNPRTEPLTFKVDETRLKYWVANGAQASVTINRLLKQAGIKIGNS